MLEMIWLTPFLQVPKPDDGAELRYSEAAVQDVRDFFGLLCFGQNEWAGKPFELLPWEEKVIREFYGVQVRDDDGTWVRYRRFSYDEIPKKNGKSEFAAGLGLYHLLWDGETLPNVGVFAADKNNADIIYQAAKYMVEHTCLGQPEHDPIAWCRDSRREIHTKFGGVLKVYSSDADSKHGYSFSAIIIDELHAQPNRKLWDVLTAGSDAARRQQAVIVLTTAGDDPDRNSIGWEIHEKCRRILAWRAGTPERELDEDDPQWCPTMYGISALTGDDPEAISALDIYDEAVWAGCNPSYGVTISKRKFRAEAKAAKKSEAAERLFRWLRLNQWIATKTVGWVPLTIYDKTQIIYAKAEDRKAPTKAERMAFRESLRGKKCYGGLDLSTTTDLTAFVLLFPPQEGVENWVALFWAWVPLEGLEEREQRDHVPYGDWIRAGFLRGCPEDIIDYDQVKGDIWAAAETYDILTLGVDPYMSRSLTQDLMNGGPEGKRPKLEVIEISQGILSLSPPTKELERMLRKREMRHEHNTCARNCFGNARAYVDGNENIKLMKNKSIGRIDITVAWVIAQATAMFKGGKVDLKRSMDKYLKEMGW